MQMKDSMPQMTQSLDRAAQTASTGGSPRIQARNGEPDKKKPYIPRSSILKGGVRRLDLHKRVLYKTPRALEAPKNV